jgi:Dihydrofolate reductase
MLSFVVAVSENNVIGKDNTLPWYLPEDLKKFKEITLSKTHTIIMGRKTFESLPVTLAGRKHIILTRNKGYIVSNNNVEIIYNLDDLEPFIKDELEYFVIGGGEIFKILLPFTQKIYLTIIHEHFEGDTFFPEYNRDEWKITEQFEGEVDEKNKHPHTYITLERI